MFSEDFVNQKKSIHKTENENRALECNNVENSLS